MRLVAMSKSEGILGGREGLCPTVFCVWLVLVRLKSSHPEHEMWRLSSPCLGPVTSLVT